MLKIVDVKTMKDIDRRAVEQYGILGNTLMEQAGKRLAGRVMRLINNDSRNRVIILAGGGKNGGDGLVSARYLSRAGVKTTVLLLSGKLAPETRENLQRLSSENIPVRQYTDQLPAEYIKMIAQADYVIDALVGIGIVGSLREPMAGVIRAVNQAKGIVVAADVPSGLNADTGEPGEPTVQAHYTITFGLPKIGLLQPVAAASVGQLIVETIGFPEQLLTCSRDKLQYYDKHSAAAQLPPRAVNAHKRSSGKVLIIGGSGSYHGAALLAAQGAKLAGAGYVSLAYPKSLDTIIRCHTLEELCVPLPGGTTGNLGPSALPKLFKLAAEADAVVIGPGLGRAKATFEMVKTFVCQALGPSVIVIDADALQALPRIKSGERSRELPAWVLTPHEGEAGCLLEQNSEYVRNHRWSAAEQISQKTAATVLLKGQHTVVVNPESPTMIIGAGSQALATAGTGDVLSGVIAALAAQKCSAQSAAALGACLHGMAGELAGHDPLGMGVIASGVAHKIPQAICALRKLPKQIH